MLRHKQTEKGAVAVWVAISLALLFVLLAVAADVGYMHVTRAELQHAADGVAMAGAWALLNGEDVVAKTQEYAGYNDAANLSTLELPDKNIVIGFMNDPLDIHAEIDTASPNDPNTVEVYMQMDGSANSKLSLLFGPIIGKNDAAIGARARAFATRRIIGFEAPDNPGDESGSSGGEIPDEAPEGNVMPFAIRHEVFDDYWYSFHPVPTDHSQYALVPAGFNPNDTIFDGPFTGTIYPDVYAVNGSNVSAGSDGKPELVLYPLSTGSSGNYGTVNINNESNDVGTIQEQTYWGLSGDDVETVGGLIEIGGTLNGDPGVSSSIRHPILSSGNWGDYPDLIGARRIFLLYDNVVGPGNTAEFHISGFVACIIINWIQKGIHSEFIVQAVDVNTDLDGLLTGGVNTGSTDLIPIIGYDAPESYNLFAIGLCR